MCHLLDGFPVRSLHCFICIVILIFLYVFISFGRSVSAHTITIFLVFLLSGVPKSMTWRGHLSMYTFNDLITSRQHTTKLVTTKKSHCIHIHTFTNIYTKRSAMTIFCHFMDIVNLLDGVAFLYFYNRVQHKSSLISKFTTMRILYHRDFVKNEQNHFKCK